MQSRPSHYIRIAMIVAPIVALGGCWEKIEYTGSTDSSTTKRPAASDSAKNATPAESKDSTPSPSTIAEAPRSTTTPVPTTPQASDDRYPPAASVSAAATEPPAPFEPKPLKKEPEDRYATARPPADTTPI